MDAFLIIKDTLDVRMAYDSLCNSRMILANDPVVACGECLKNMNTNHDDVVIVAIVCVTLLVLALLTIGLILYVKSKSMAYKIEEIKLNNEAEKVLFDKKIAMEAEKEKSRYRTRLADYLEKKEDKTEYTEVLKNYIDNLTPSKGKVG